MNLEKETRKKHDLLLLDFCNVKKWELETIAELYEVQLPESQVPKYRIQRDRNGEPKDIIINCKTRHDRQHKYVLVENDLAKTLQKHIPESYILPSQLEFQNLWKYLKKSQVEYRRFLDSCINGKLDLSYLNRLLQNVETAEPAFFSMCLAKPKKKEVELLKWNPMLRLMSHGECIEDAIELEIINTILGQLLMQQVDPQRPIFSRIRRCLYPQCRRHFIAERPTTAKHCCKKCQVDHNNLLKKKTGYSKKYQSEARRHNKGVYQLAAQRRPRSS
jgi:hypothetical protein